MSRACPVGAAIWLMRTLRFLVVWAAGTLALRAWGGLAGPGAPTRPPGDDGIVGPPRCEPVLARPAPRSAAARTKAV